MIPSLGAAGFALFLVLIIFLIIQFSPETISKYKLETTIPGILISAFGLGSVIYLNSYHTITLKPVLVR